LSSDFIKKLEKKISQQLSSQRVGFLLGAGASYLSGKGYPLSSQLWGQISAIIPKKEREEIQSKLDEGAAGLEQALDLLDTGGVNDIPHRHLVTEATFKLFSKLSPPLEVHSRFLNNLSKTSESVKSIFCINWDPILERAATKACIPLEDGFKGFDDRFFYPSIFQKRSGMVHRGRKSHPEIRIDSGVIHLYKLHGSVGWYEIGNGEVRCCTYDDPIPSETKRLMIPPQYRKAVETTAPPYSMLWSEFRRLLVHGPDPINRLVSIGYGMQDEHINAVIDNGLRRSDFTLMIFAKRLSDQVFERWSAKENTIIITQDRCSLYGDIDSGHEDLWDYERLSLEV